MRELKGKVLFVTGGANGIGKGIVNYFVKKGCSVAFCDINIEQGKATSKQTGADFYYTDASDAKSLQTTLQAVCDRFGSLDIIINNVGIFKPQPLVDVKLEDFDRVMATNLRPIFITSQFMARNRASNKGKYGRIINISSTRYLQSEPGTESYAASKGGIYSLTHALAISLADYNITVNSISPGWIDTGHYPISEADKKQHPSRRVGTPEDVARLCWMLCQKKNDFINAENIVIDGGMTKKMIYLE